MKKANKKKKEKKREKAINQKMKPQGNKTKVRMTTIWINYSRIALRRK